MDHERAALVHGRLAEKLFKPEGMSLLPAEVGEAELELGRLAHFMGRNVLLALRPAPEALPDALQELVVFGGPPVTHVEGADKNERLSLLRLLREELTQCVRGPALLLLGLVNEPSVQVQVVEAEE